MGTINLNGLSHSEIATIFRNFYPDMYEETSDDDIVSMLQKDPQFTHLNWDNMINEPGFFQRGWHPVKHSVGGAISRLTDSTMWLATADTALTFVGNTGLFALNGIRGMGRAVEWAAEGIAGKELEFFTSISGQKDIKPLKAGDVRPDIYKEKSKYWNGNEGKQIFFDSFFDIFPDSGKGLFFPWSMAPGKEDYSGMSEQEIVDYYKENFIWKSFLIAEFQIMFFHDFFNNPTMIVLKYHRIFYFSY